MSGRRCISSKPRPRATRSFRDGLNMLSACENIQLLLNKSRFQPGGRRYGTYYGYGA